MRWGWSTTSSGPTRTCSMATTRGSDSYFENSDLASSGIPQGDELKLLEPFRQELPPELFTQPFTLPVTDGSGNNREQLIQALKLMQQAGWQVKDRKLVDASGQQMSFTILLDDPSYERVALPYIQDIQRLGIDVRARTVDPAQYQHVTDDFDFDMMLYIYPEGDVPGNELRDYFSCASAKAQGSANVPGVCDPAVDALVEKVITAQDRADPADRGARAGPGAAVALVHGAELFQPEVPCRLVEPVRLSRQADPRGVQLRHLVGGRRQGRGDRRGASAMIAPADGGVMAGLSVPPPAAGDPHPVRHHRHQLRGHPVRAGRPGGPDDRRAARPRRHVLAADRRQLGDGRSGDLSRGARPRSAHDRRSQQDVRLRQAAADALRRDGRRLPALRLRPQLLPRSIRSASGGAAPAGVGIAGAVVDHC